MPPEIVKSRGSFQTNIGILLSILSVIIFFLIVYISPEVFNDPLQDWKLLSEPAFYSYLLCVLSTAHLFKLLVLLCDSICCINFNTAFQETSKELIFTLLPCLLSVISLVTVNDENKLPHIFCLFSISMFFAGFLLINPYGDAELALSQDNDSSIGAYWAFGAYKNAYYERILKDITTRIRAFEESNEGDFFVNKLIVICPLSCNIESTLSGKDSRIKHIGCLEIIEDDQGANMNRRYKNPVYDIDGSGKLVAAEFASPLGTLWKMRKTMPNEIWKYHRDSFISALRMLLKNEPCIVLEYDDEVSSEDQDSSEAQPLHEFLLSSLKTRR